jgi:hypothetical protein
VYYVNVSRQQVEDMRPVIELLFQIWGEDIDQNALFLYGMVDQNSPVIAAMKSETGQSVTAGVVAIPISTDALYYLTGSGYALKREAFLYASGGELRTSVFGEADQEPVVTLSSFTKLALSSSDSWMDRYFKLENPEAINENKGGEVDRTEDAVEHAHNLEDSEHGGLVSEEPEVVKSSSLPPGKIIKIWADSNIESWSVEELMQLLHRLAEDHADTPESEFFLWSASDLSGYLIQVSGGTGAAARLISSKLNIDAQEVASEGVGLTGRELATTIEGLLGS